MVIGDSLSNESTWEMIFSSQAWGKYPSEDLIRFIARRYYSVLDRQTIKILEIGCGPGANLWYLAREGFSVYGIDFSKTAINQAQERLNHECPGWQGELVVGDMAKLPFEDSFFDAIIDIEAVYCNSYEKSQDIYREAARVCKQGGVIFSRTFARGCWGDGTGQKVNHNTWIPTEGPFVGKGLTRFTEQTEVANLLSRFKVIELELISRTVNQLQNEIKEWIITAQKC